MDLATIFEGLPDDTLLTDSDLQSIAFLCGEQQTLLALDLIDARQVVRITVLAKDSGSSLLKESMKAAGSQRSVFQVTHAGRHFVCLPAQQFCGCRSTATGRPGSCVHLLAVHLAQRMHKYHDHAVDKDRFAHIVASAASTSA
ncbi:hypothetical protein BC831DRAFT_552034 [Entophlyctis helioformis]|nr:hypothetical protein BC831DRAFT_552034 [Entophlyctis helioformis]